MSKALITDTIRTIKKSLGRFISLTSIVAIGVAFFVGVSASAPIMAYSVDKYDDQTNMMDITIFSNYGFDEDDLNALRALDSVKQVEGAYFVDVVGFSDQQSKIVRIHSFNNTETSINRFILVEGRLPEKPTECLAENGSYLSSMFKIGDTISITRPNDDLDDFTDYDTLTVVGLIDTPVYLNEEKETSTLSNRYIQTYLYVNEDMFNTDYYLQAILTLEDGATYNTFNDEYNEYVKPIKEDIETLGQTQAETRKDSVVSEAMDEYNDGLDEYNDGLDEYNTKIADAKQEIADGEKDIISGQKELNDAIEELANKKQETNDLIVNGYIQIHDARNQIGQGQAQLQEKEAEYLAQKPTLLNNLQLINNGIDQINTTLPQLQTGLDGVNAITLPLTTDASTLTSLYPQFAPVVDLVNATGGSVTDIASLKTGITNLQTNLTNLKTGLIASGIPDATPIATVKTLIANPTIEAMIDMLMANDSSIVDMGTLKTSIDNIQASLTSADAGIDSVTHSDSEPIGSFLASYPPFQTLYDSLTTQGYTINNVGDLKTSTTSLIASLQTQLATLTQQKQQIEQGMADAEKQISDAKEELERAYGMTINASTELDNQAAEANVKFAEAEEEIARNQQKLEDGKKELADAKVELEDAIIDGQQELDDAKADLDKALQDINDLEDGEWTVLDRTQHYATVTYKDTVGQMKAIANVFPVFFFLVAALVCLTTMTRMIDEQRGQIGVLRALGYNNGSIISKYLIYALSATFIGNIIGSIVGMLVFPGIIYTAWEMMYILPKMEVYIPWDIIILANVSFLAIMGLTTYAGIHSSIKEVPSQLLRPKPPKNGKATLFERIKPIWSHMSFTSKVTARNLIRYKKRFFMTVIGVAGCTALLITGFGIRDSITSCVDVQFKEIYQYDGSITFDDDLAPSDMNKLIEKINQNSDVDKTVTLGMYAGKMYNQNGEEEVVTTEVYTTTDTINDAYTLRTRNQHHSISLTNDGIVISEKLATLLNLSIGDEVSIESETGVRRNVKITGICEMYIYHYVFMSDEYYQQTFGTSIKHNTLYIDLNEQAANESSDFQKDLVALDGVKSISFFDVVLNNFNQMINGLNLIVIVLIISSGALALVVLINLTNVNIEERQREIATLKVLGFNRKEVDSYVYKENIILTLIGSLVGIILGMMLHQYIIRLVEMSYVMFGRNVHPTSMLLSVIITLGFGLIVNILMRKKLNGIEMVESLKSVE